MYVYKITIYLTTHTDELPNGREMVTILHTEEDEKDKLVLFSKSIIMEHMKIIIKTNNSNVINAFFFLNILRHVKSNHF